MMRKKRPRCVSEIFYAGYIDVDLVDAVNSDESLIGSSGFSPRVVTTDTSTTILVPIVGPMSHLAWLRSWYPTYIGSPEFPAHDLIKAAKRVRRVNQKLAAFERGFISKEGIRNREWYKHLGVAPGLWLGESSL